MFFTKRNGIYYLWYVHPVTNKKCKISTGSSSKKDAYQFMHDFDHQKKLDEKNSHAYSLSQLKQDYLIYSASVHTHKTYLCNQNALEQFLSFTGDMLLKDVGIRDVEKFIAHIQKTKSAWTAKKHFAHLASTFTRALVWKKIGSVKIFV